jgi:hypothetical protein
MLREDILEGEEEELGLYVLRVFGGLLGWEGLSYMNGWQAFNGSRAISFMQPPPQKTTFTSRTDNK